MHDGLKQEVIRDLQTVETQLAPVALYAERLQLQTQIDITPSTIFKALLLASEARQHARSYRDFNVGAALLALYRTPAEARMITGVNIKPHKGPDALNEHAEQLALERIEQSRAQGVPLIAVVGDTQPDKQSGREMETLHPCGICRNVLTNSALIDDDRTLVVTARPDFSVIELSSLEGLTRYHGNEHDPSGIIQTTAQDAEATLQSAARRRFSVRGGVGLHRGDAYADGGFSA